MEIEECVEAINSDVVMQEVDVRPLCITKHPGFVNLSLDEWSLHFAATNLKTRNKQYRQTSTEDR